MPRLDEDPLDVALQIKRGFEKTISSSDKPICAVENGKIVGVVDKNDVLAAIAGEGD